MSKSSSQMNSAEDNQAVADEAREWTAKQHRKDAKVVQDVLMRVAERSTGQSVFVPEQDASDVLMGLHHAGLYRPEQATREALALREVRRRALDVVRDEQSAVDFIDWCRYSYDLDTDDPR